MANGSPMTVDDAMAIALSLAAQESPNEAPAVTALRLLRNEVWYRWEQRTALSFRLQDLRAAAVTSGIDDQSPLYLALHDVTATAEGWMHPGTLDEASAARLRTLEAQLARAQQTRLGTSPAFKVTYLLDSPWPTDASNPEGFEALTWKRTGELPFMPQLGLLMECGDGDLRKVHEIYWYVDRPHEIELYFEDEEYKHDTAYYLASGWTTEDLPPPQPAAPGRKKRGRAHG